MWGFSSCSDWGLLLWWRAGSVVAAHGLNCPVACGICPDQGSNPPVPHTGSQILNHRITGEVPFDILNWIFTMICLSYQEAKDQKAPQCTLIYIYICVCILFLNFFPHTWSGYSLLCMYSWILTAGISMHTYTYVPLLDFSYTSSYANTVVSAFPCQFHVYLQHPPQCSIFALKLWFNRKIQIK